MAGVTGVGATLAQARTDAARKLAERQRWLAALSPSKYQPHQGKRECARRLRRLISAS